MLINFVDATNDANHYTNPPPTLQNYLQTISRVDMREKMLGKFTVCTVWTRRPYILRRMICILPGS